MLRSDIVNIVNKLAEKGGMDFKLLKCYDLIFNYCKENKTRPRSNNYDLKNGCLYINNQFIRRVDSLYKEPFDEQLYYLAGKILAQSELID